MALQQQLPLLLGLGVVLIAACGSVDSGTAPPDSGAGGADAAGGTGGSAGSPANDSGLGDGGTSPGGNGGADGGSGCPSLAGPPMVALPGGYCIDSTEVTRGQYAAWLQTNPSLVGRPGGCGLKQNYDPDSTCMKDARIYQGPNSDQHPQECVDWCDAYMYCWGVGKRLCGRIGGGSNDYADYADATKSQWYAACSSGGASKYPYGNTYDPKRCNGQDSGNATTVEPGSMAGCQPQVPGYQAVFDLSGNVVEWEDSCNGDSRSDDWCHTRGGGFWWSSPDSMACDSPDAGYRKDAYGVVGFRCCWP